MSREFTRQLAAESHARGDATGWFESLYASAGNDYGAVPWADLAPNPNLIEWFVKHPVANPDQRALVVGCGYGDDAEFLANLGFDVTAFDIAPTAIAQCQTRFPTSSVSYQVADLCYPPEAWQRAFDFVFESYTLQSLPVELHRMAIAQIVQCVAPQGTVLAIARGREETEPLIHLPFPLTINEFKHFETCGMTLESFEDYLDQEDPPQRRFRGLYSHP
jgi:SAM-dependent methyltransferase